ncbi:MAG: hypothetical protein JNL08_08780 [Planctomycetes bacterium]|nr:hypothetical protein [Planctomycetota bacterium]
MSQAELDPSRPLPASAAGTDAAARRRTLGRLAGVALLLAGAVSLAGWFAVMCDDAFITFRYVANARDGLGLVWNPPPFLPVEGYTSFSWALLLWAAWSWFGVEPPYAANPMSIACGAVALVLVAVAAFRLRDRDGRAVSAAVAYAVLLAVGSNRTFARFLTGGLETELFNLLFLGWVLLAFRSPARRSTTWLAAWSALAALAALTRPDGLLLVAATLAAAGPDGLVRRRQPLGLLCGLAPLLGVALHTLWRHSFYGAWLPNTYYAKVSTPWPEAGLRYLACYLFEHGGWLWVPLATVWCVVEPLRAPRAALHAALAQLPAVAAVATVACHAAYYVVVVGGDGFEYRVFSHLVPMCALAAAAMAARLGRGSALPVLAALGLVVGNGWGWLHLATSEHRIPPHYDCMEPKVPSLLRPLARWHDRQRFWLQLHMICLPYPRGPSYDAALPAFPPRVRRPFPQHDVPIAHESAVGLRGWLLADVAVIDTLGLNDWVTARTPVPAWQLPFLPREPLMAALAAVDPDGDGVATRDEMVRAFTPLMGGSTASAADFAGMMLLLFGAERDRLAADEVARLQPFFARYRMLAHERRPPPGYLDDLPANVTIEGREVRIVPRAVPLDADRVRQVEAAWRERTGAKPRD